MEKKQYLRYLFISLLSLNICAKALDAHVHGNLNIDIATDKKDVFIIFKSPADSILGFEHRPKNKEQGQVISEAIRSWKTSLYGVFSNNLLRECKIKDTNWNHRFATNNHSSIESDVLLSCTKNASGIKIKIDMTKKLEKVRDIFIKQIKNNGSFKSIRSKNKPFTIEL